VTRPRLALLWHLHQPLYRLRDEPDAVLPWVRLHALRGYYDMVRVLDDFPEARVTVNLTPVLVEQIRACAEGAGDAYLRLASVPAEDLDEGQRHFVCERFFPAQEAHMIRPQPRFAELLEQRQAARKRRGPRDAFREFATQDLRDLQVLFDLAWCGFKAREDFPILRSLAEQGGGFVQRDIEQLHAVEREIVSRLLPLYREAARRGQVEIATSPYAHPILPLLLDTEAAREARPEADLPPRLQAPEDARTHVMDGLASIEKDLGVRPRGLWPSEGSVSEAAVGLLHECGVAWAASDERVLAASARDGEGGHERAWRLASSPDGPDLLFRDRDLSDRISFSYAGRDPAEAAADFLHEAGRRGGGARLVLVALDGENPWEHYPDAGGPFLRALYGAAGPGAPCELATVSEALAATGDRGTLRRLRAGSWIDADFSTWIGGPEKNLAWSVLAEARARIAAALRDAAPHDAALREPAPGGPALPAAAKAAAWASLRAAEGSDWFWWLDGQFSTPDRAAFDALFRSHLKEACAAARVAPPEALARPIPAPHRLAGPEQAA
jgi:alpha-amylase/alpha-mannosidase (GH57 family)